MFAEEMMLAGTWCGAKCEAAPMQVAMVRFPSGVTMTIQHPVGWSCSEEARYESTLILLRCFLSRFPVLSFPTSPMNPVFSPSPASPAMVLQADPPGLMEAGFPRRSRSSFHWLKGRI